MLAPKDNRQAAVASALDRFAHDHGVDRSIAAYSWLTDHPAGIIPIIGSQNPKRIDAAVKALDVNWDRKQWYDVFVAARGEALP